MSAQPSADLTPQELGERILAAAAGDRAAATELLARALPRVRNLVRYLVRGDSDVDDISQRVLLELLGSFRTFRGIGSFEGWCDRITVRVTLHDRRAARSYQRKKEQTALELYAVRDEGSGPDDYLNRRRLAQKLDGVPLEQRQALVLHHCVGLSVREVASELAIPFETARSRLRLGSARLRALLEDPE
jgi:RNA polymerase sigma-70 factor (ECF subfamily)